MTVSSTTTRNSYTGDGTTTVFAYTFKIFDDDDITVILRTTATGAETVQTKTTHYSVSGVGNTGGGNITFVTPPTAAQTVVLLRQTAQTQTTDYTPNDPFPAASHEDALDKLTLIQQDQQDELDRAIKLSRTNTMTSTEFTVGASTRANKIFAFDSSGELSVTQEIGTYQGTDATTTTSAYSERDIIKSTTAGQLNNVYICVADSVAGDLLTDTDHFELLVDAVSAATSATNAAASETAAAASETAAAASESAAATSETNAATSESNASTSATNAASSATAAAASETAAAASETAAAASETAAAASETAAAASETAAAASETAAAASESAASTSETNAAASETAAAASEAAAATSETNAATSASAAASDASAAAASAAAAAASFDAFDDIYLGAKASPPTVDNDGDALTNGDLYFDTGDNELYIWNGSAWQAASPNIVADTTPQLGGNLDVNGNDINFGDNDKAVFGAGSDLQIYHNGTDSVVDDQGTGKLVLKGNTAVEIRGTNGEDLAGFNMNGAVNLYYDNAEKLATTNTGIDVTGTAVTDGLTVAGNVSVDGGTIKLDGNYPVGTANVALGDAALSSGSLSGGYNVAVGTSALENNTTADYNTAVGYQAGYNTTTGQANTVVGYGAAFNNTTGTENTAFSLWSLQNNTTGTRNTAIGVESLKSNTTASNNTAVGYQAGYSGTTASTSTAIGTQALYSNSTGNSITAVGYRALYAQTGAGPNTAVGVNSQLNTTTGTNNVSMGYNSAYSTTTGSSNIAIGLNALYSNTTADNNTAVGYQAAYSSTTGSSGANFGRVAGYSNTTGTENTNLGAAAGYTCTTSSNNTMVGAGAGFYATGSDNTMVGKDAGILVTTGAKNTILGRYNGNSGGLDIRTSSNNIVLSDGDGNPRGIFDGSGNFLVGKTSIDLSTVGVEARANGSLLATKDGDKPLLLNRLTSDGDIVEFRKDGSAVGGIGTEGGDLTIGTGDTGFQFYDFSDAIRPWNFSSNTSRDNAIDLGTSGDRFDDIYATNGTIQTSDANDKQDIQALSDAEQRVAVAAKGLLRKFRWKSAVEEKGDDARIHFGIIAQDLQAAFEAEGLDAGRYAMFIHSEWWEHSVDVPAVEADPENDIEAVEAYTRVDTYSTQEEAPEGAVQRSRMGVRYNELLAFIIAAI